MEELLFPPIPSSSVTHKQSGKVSFSFDDASVYAEFFPKLFFDDALGVLRAVRGKILMALSAVDRVNPFQGGFKKKNFNSRQIFLPLYHSIFDTID